MASTPTPPPAPPGVGDALPPRRSGGSSSSSHHAAATATAEAPFDFDRFHALHFPGAMRELLAPTTVPGPSHFVDM